MLALELCAIWIASLLEEAGAAGPGIAGGGATTPHSFGLLQYRSWFEASFIYRYSDVLNNAVPHLFAAGLGAGTCAGIILFLFCPR